MKFDEDLEYILICAVRYALEKQSYMTDHVIRYIKSNAHRLSEWCLYCLWESIGIRLEAVDHIDRHIWVELMERLRKEKEGR